MRLFYLAQLPPNIGGLDIPSAFASGYSTTVEIEILEFTGGRVVSSDSEKRIETTNIKTQAQALQPNDLPAPQLHWQQHTFSLEILECIDK